MYWMATISRLALRQSRDLNPGPLNYKYPALPTASELQGASINLKLESAIMMIVVKGKGIYSCIQQSCKLLIDIFVA